MPFPWMLWVTIVFVVANVANSIPKFSHESMILALVTLAPGVVRRRIYAPYQGIAAIVISD